MSGHSLMRCGEYRTNYKSDTTIFPTPVSRNVAIASVLFLLVAAPFLNAYHLNLLIQIGYYGIAALGLNILVGFTGQISLGHAAFFGFGAFASAWINNTTGIPVFLAIPLAGLMTTAVGMIVGIPAGRIKGLYLAIATLASQFILEDFFARADWFTGGTYGSMANPVNLFGFDAPQNHASPLVAEVATKSGSPAAGAEDRGFHLSLPCFRCHSGHRQERSAPRCRPAGGRCWPCA